MQIRDRLPKGFVLAKPIAQEGYDEAIIYELERQGRLRITRKRDGWKMLALVDSKGLIRLYTDGINEIDSRFDHIKKELQKLKLPSQTLVVGEAIIDINDNDDLGKVISIFHSNLERSLVLQKEYGKIGFMIFAVISLNRSSSGLSTLDHDYSYKISTRKFKYIFNVTRILKTFSQSKRLVVEKDWEGLVLYDKDYQLTYRTDGKAPQRPEGCYKWKPIYEDDFIVREWISRPDGTVKELVLLQIDPVTRLEFYCGKLGTFSNEMRKKLAKTSYPIVVQAKFEARFPKTGKIRNARFMRIRDDKPAEQCIAPKRYSESYLKSYKKLPAERGYCNKCEMMVDFNYDPERSGSRVIQDGWTCERCGHWVEEIPQLLEE